jgi:regulator of sirC expression with transglutaminase-like and TPR domain
MNKMDTINPSPELTALVNLLDEPDETAFSKVKEKLFYFGKEALPLLVNARDDVFDSQVQERIDQIIHKIHLDDVTAEFTSWLNTGSSELLKGFMLISRTDDPLLDEDPIIQEVEQIRMDAWLEMNDNLTALENVKVLNHIIFHVHYFDGNKTDPMAAENFFLPSLLKSHKGSSLTLGMLYLIIAQKLNIPIVGVNLPQHFILAYLSEENVDQPTVDDIQFYLNPMNRGSVFTRREIELFISQLKIQADISYFAPCSNIDIIYRLIENLIIIYDQQNLTEKIDDLEYLKKLIESM